MRLLCEGGFSRGFAWGSFMVSWDLVVGFPSMLWDACPFPFLLCPALAEHPQHAGRWLVSCPALEGSWVLLAWCLLGPRKAEDRTLLRAVSTIHCKNIPLGAQGLVGIRVWPAQCGSRLSWKAPWQAAPTVVCTVQEASPLQGGCKSETSQQYLCTSVLDSSAFSFPPLPQGIL